MNLGGLDPREMEFLYPHETDPYEPGRMFERSFFMDDDTEVPPKYPAKAPAPTPYEIVLDFLLEHDLDDLLSILVFVSREWCRTVRKHRFSRLHLEPGMNFPLLLQVFRPTTVLPYVRQLHINGRLNEDANHLPDGDADHRWLQPLTPLIAALCRHSPIDYLFLQSLSWGDIPIAIRTVLITALPGVRALGIHGVDFWNSNQFLRVLNAYPRLQFLQIWHAMYHALNHVPSQILRTEPLLLTEVVLGCAYTGLIMEWLLGSRKVLAIEELTVTSRNMYRDDPRLARVLRKVSPWLKLFHYEERGGEAGCEGPGYGDDDDITDKINSRPLRPEIVRVFDTHSDDEEIVENMDVDDEDDEDDMDEDPDELIGGSSQELASASQPVPAAQAKKPPHMVEVKKMLLLPDDVEQNHLENGEDELYQPPFAFADDYGYRAFADELAHWPIEMPMFEQVEAEVYWRNLLSLLTLKMVCTPIFTSDEFYRFDIAVHFESEELYDNAPWRQIDRIFATATLPEDPEAEQDDDESEAESDLMFRLEVSVKGWNIRGKEGKAKLKDLKKKMPRTVRERKVGIQVGTWLRVPPRAGPPNWLQTY